VWEEKSEKKKQKILGSIRMCFKVAYIHDIINMVYVLLWLKM
jgi:hypothetical protein